MRLLALIEYAAVVIGIIGMIAGRFFALHKGFEFGVFMAGAGIALGGIEALATRRMCFRPSEDAYEAYAGAPAVIVGLMGDHRLGAIARQAKPLRKHGRKRLPPQLVGVDEHDLEGARYLDFGRGSKGAGPGSRLAPAFSRRSR